MGAKTKIEWADHTWNPWRGCEHDAVSQLGKKAMSGIDWVIVGGESGHHARPMHPDWVRGIRDQCHAGGVPFFFKQWGGTGLEKVNVLAERMQTLWHGDDGQ